MISSYDLFQNNLKKKKDSVFSTKKLLRHYMLAHRQRLAAAHGPVLARCLALSALLLLSRIRHIYGYHKGIIVAGYWPIAGEVDVRPLLWRLSCLGCRTALPVIVKKTVLAFRICNPHLKLERGPYGTLHPPAGRPQVIPDVILVPLLAFDSAGFRLGFGAGYYDRTLAWLRLRRRRKIVAIGIAFADQEIPHVPRHRHDIAMDLMWCGWHRWYTSQPRRFVSAPLRVKQRMVKRR